MENKPIENKPIRDFKIGDNVQGFFLIKEVKTKFSSNNKPYLDITLSDSTGEINAKVWDSTKEDESVFIENTLVKIRGSVLEWQGKPQLKINKVRLVTEEDNVNISDYVITAPEDPEHMYKQILVYANSIKNEDIKNITKYIVEDSKDKLMYYPAAKSNHHSMKAGLLYHILTMLRCAEALSNIYTNLNKDLLYAGVILHDIAKLEEMESNELGIVSDYTKEGQLLGHIIQGIKKINRVAELINADREAALLLEHMVLSHHYEPEFGSPKRPMFPEAEMLHYLDIIDSRMYDMTKALETVDKNGFSERIWVLHNRQVYKTDIG